MNKDLKHEEEIREMVLDSPCDEDGRPYGWAANKVKVGKKTLSIFSDWAGEIRFEKKKFFSDALEVCCVVKDEKEEKCSLGHWHVVESKERRHRSAQLPWGDVERLIEWLQLGSWSQVRGGRPSHVKSIKRAVDFIEAIDVSDVKMLQSEKRNVIRELREELKGYGLR